MNIADLADMINEQTGAEGAELECMTFYIAAGFADCMGKKDIGDYFAKRIEDSKKRLPEGHPFTRTY